MKPFGPSFALPGLVLVAGCSAVAPFLPIARESHSVPWVASTAGPVITQAPDPIPAETRRCDVSQLALLATVTGAGGALVGELRLSLPENLRPCVLAGPPASIAIQDAETLQDVQTRYERSSRSGPGASTTRSAPAVLVGLDAPALASFIWSNWCGNPRATFRFLVRASSSTSATEAISNASAGGPRCDDPRSASIITGYAFRSPPAQPDTIDVAIEAPPTAVAGEPLDYTVTLTNRDTLPLMLDACPAYTEELYRPKHPETYQERWLLNCSDLPAKIWPGEEVQLAMRLSVPHDTPLGPAEIAWNFLYGRAESSIQVLAH